MLQSLHVKNLALIDEIEIDFKEGFNILTGETGAGKSIILGSVNLALGGRYTKEMIREGAEYGFVELTFFVEDASQIEALHELGVYPEDGLLILSRKLMEGRSISRVNGEAITAGRLREISSILIDIHGQHDHQSLLYKKNHLQFVDAFCKDRISDLKTQIKASYERLKQLKSEWEASDIDEASRLKEMSFLKFEIDEISAANLTLSEDEELENNFNRMENAKRIKEGALLAWQMTEESGGSASNLLSRAIRELSVVAAYDKRASELYDQLADVDNLLNDFNRELSVYLSSLDFSEEEYFDTQRRLNEINHLKSKYGSSIDAILSYADERKNELEKLDDHERYLDELKQKIEKEERTLSNLCDELSKIRRDEAWTLANQIEEGLIDLNFPDVRFEIHFEKLPHCTVNGSDDVEFRIALNPGQSLKPLSMVASGGELSRIMLALKTVMANKDAIDTLIFDEIDVGISGRTAQKVAEKMAAIAKNRQVICITHLAQIAAMSDAHFLISKTVVDDTAKTTIRCLSDGDVVEELARMLGGVLITDAVRENAKEMRQLAKEKK